jgi:hypothetical protein
MTSSPRPILAASSCEVESAGPGIHADAETCLAVGGELLLEGCDFATQCELAAVENALDSRR